MQKRKNFIYISESFICEYCQEANPVPTVGIRNHCRACLASKHVDLTVPGDREANCHGKMAPISIRSDKKRDWVLTHSCLDCGTTSNNKVAEDDDIDQIAKLINKTNLQNAQQGSA